VAVLPVQKFVKLHQTTLPRVQESVLYRHELLLCFLTYWEKKKLPIFFQELTKCPLSITKVLKFVPVPKTKGEDYSRKFILKKRQWQSLLSASAWGVGLFSKTSWGETDLRVLLSGTEWQNGILQNGLACKVCFFFIFLTGQLWPNPRPKAYGAKHWPNPESQK
jgi:hypothetical protein